MQTPTLRPVDPNAALRPKAITTSDQLRSRTADQSFRSQLTQQSDSLSTRQLDRRNSAVDSPRPSAAPKIRDAADSTDRSTEPSAAAKNKSDDAPTDRAADEPSNPSSETRADEPRPVATSAEESVESKPEDHDPEPTAVTQSADVERDAPVDVDLALQGVVAAAAPERPEPAAATPIRPAVQTISTQTPAVDHSKVVNDSEQPPDDAHSADRRTVETSPRPVAVSEPSRPNEPQRSETAPRNEAPLANEPARKSAPERAPRGDAIEQAHKAIDQRGQKGLDLNNDARQEGGRSSFEFSQQGSSARPAEVRATQVEQAIQLGERTAPSASTGTTESQAQTPRPQAVSVSGADASRGGNAASAPAPRSNELVEAFSSRIVRGLNAMVNHRGGAMTMRLDPPELGQMRVQMTVLQGAVTAAFQVETEQAHSLLRQNMATLRHSLESQGLVADRLTVHLTPSSTESSSSNSGRSQDQANSERHQANAGEGESRGRRDEGYDGESEQRGRFARPEFAGAWAEATS